MRLHDPLDNILNNEVKVKILRFLCKTEAEWSGRQIAQEIKVSPAACHKALRELNNERTLLLRSVGKSYLYRLNEENLIVSDLLKPLYERERRIPDEVYEAIVRNVSSLVIKDIISIAVFGSVERGKERPTSDIDLLVVVKNPENKRKIEEDFEKINEKIISGFGNTVSTYLQTADEVKSKYKKGLGLIKDILKSHRLLFGKPLENLLNGS
ncbi:nucleotidyltransferase domain-containing protein [Candidatus Gottesmanbacteria bacterium]|nr:nucleotidyltransferase domain-containing protein [Candidatus Gottesmanbacteria bacterium]